MMNLDYLKRIFSFFLTFVTLSFAASVADAFDYNRAINLAGKQRMLTQKMTKEALLVALDVDKQANLENLKKTVDLFDQTLNGLLDGDESLGLQKTKKPKIRKQLNKIMEQWIEFYSAVNAIYEAKEITQEQVATMAAKNIPLLKEMNKAVKFYEADAAGGGTNPALAKAINLAGRQRMLTQKMSKEFLLVAYGYEADANKTSLSETIQLFDTTLTGLIDGDPSVGLSPAPSDEIKAQLEKVKGMWAEFRKYVEGSADAKQNVADNNLPLLKEMNAAVQMFEKI